MWTSAIRFIGGTIRSLLILIVLLSFAASIGICMLIFISIGLPWWAAVVCTLALTAVFFELTLKRRLVKALSADIFLIPTTPTAFILLDTAILERDTRELIDIGFVQIADVAYGVAPPGGPPLPEPLPATISPASRPHGSIPQFFRVFAHPYHRCLAWIEQGFMPGRTPQSMQCGIVSSLGDGWQLTSSNGPGRSYSYLYRLPRSLTFRYRDAAPEKLLTLHVQERQKIVADLRVAVEPSGSLEDFVAIMQSNRQDSRLSVRRQLGVQLFIGATLARFMSGKSNSKWLGDYAKFRP